MASPYPEEEIHTESEFSDISFEEDIIDGIVFKSFKTLGDMQRDTAREKRKVEIKDTTDTKVEVIPRQGTCGSGELKMFAACMDNANEDSLVKVEGPSMGPGGDLGLKKCAIEPGDAPKPDLPQEVDQNNNEVEDAQRPRRRGVPYHGYSGFYSSAIHDLLPTSPETKITHADRAKLLEYFEKKSKTPNMAEMVKLAQERGLLAKQIWMFFYHARRREQREKTKRKRV